MIQGIFYARFRPQEGTSIVAQSPPGCIVASSDVPADPSHGNTHAGGTDIRPSKPPLLDFDIIQEYIIPRKAFFNRFLTVNSPDGKYSVLGFPVRIPHERYQRNEFLFNFGLVVESDVDHVPYERLVRRLALTFAEMERQNMYLSSDGSRAVANGWRPIESLLEIIKEDLNNYGECMIPVDEANTLNMKLFPYHPPPAAVRGWHVPVPKMNLRDLVDPTWDLTVQKIIPHIDGVNDVRRVAWLADVSLPLTQTAMRHLLYYDTILLLDMFFFGSCYAPRPSGIHDFVANRDGLIDECAAYVYIYPSPSGDPDSHHGMADGGRQAERGGVPSSSSPEASRSHGGGGHGHGNGKNGKTGPGKKSKHDAPDPSTGEPQLSHYQLVKLMTTFCSGRSVMEWIRLHQLENTLNVGSGGSISDGADELLRRVDVRRLVQFGVIKGILYRVHKYAVSKNYLEQLATGRAPLAAPLQRQQKLERQPLAAESVKSGTGKQKPFLAGPGRAGSTGATARAMAATRAGNRQHDEDDDDTDDDDEDEDGDDEDDKPDDDSAKVKPPPLLYKYADGRHCFDQIITEQNLTDAQIMERLRLDDPRSEATKSSSRDDLTILYR